MFSPDTPDHAVLMSTVAFAAEAHFGKKRKGKYGLSYIYHPINVAMNLIKAGIHDLATLQAAILHDVIEDTKYTQVDIEDQFGVDVGDLVWSLTDEDLPIEIRKAKQIEIAKTYDWRQAAIRTSDKIDNLNSIVILETPWKKDRIIEYTNFTLEVVKAIPDEVQNQQILKAFKDTVKKVHYYLYD